jgi:hypothetical protein
MAPKHLIVALGSATALALGAAVGAGAMPTNGKTLYITGSCDGIPVTLADQSSGPSAFNLADGHVGVGRVFRVVYRPTGEIVEEDHYGPADTKPLVHCVFPIPPEFSPDGTADWDFVVDAWFPRGL